MTNHNNNDNSDNSNNKSNNHNDNNDRTGIVVILAPRAPSRRGRRCPSPWRPGSGVMQQRHDTNNNETYTILLLHILVVIQ